MMVLASPLNCRLKFGRQAGQLIAGVADVAFGVVRIMPAQPFQGAGQRRFWFGGQRSMGGR